MRRLVYHVDVNSAFLSWEAVRRVARGEADLRQIPAVISGDPQKRHGVVLAKSIPARQRGVITGEPLISALKKCPDLVVAMPDHVFYQEMSEQFISILREFSPIVEPVSVDECYLDMSGMERTYQNPCEAAYLIGNEIRTRLGFTVNVGVARCKLLAKMASDFEKPDRVHTLFPEELPEKFWPLPVRDLLMVGRSTADKLALQGIKTIGMLAQVELPLLCAIVGEKQGMQLHAYANGIDPTPIVGQNEAAKGYSNSVTLRENIVTISQAHQVIFSLVDRVTSRMRHDGVRAMCIGVQIRSNQMKTSSHQRKLSQATDITSEIAEIVEQLFLELWDKRTPLRLIGVSLTMLMGEQGEQLTLFPNAKKEQQRKLDQVVDTMRYRFGSPTICRASQLSRAEASIFSNDDCDVPSE